MTERMTIILSPYEDPASGQDWDEQTPGIKEDLTQSLSAAKVTEYEVKETNHGLGADWPTITLLLLAANLFFEVPEFYQRVQSAIAGWQRIAHDVKSIINKLSERQPVVGLSEDILFLLSIDHIAGKWKVDGGSLALIDINRDIPVEFRPFSEEVNRPLLYTFSADDLVYQVVISADGSILWSQELKLNP